MKKVIRIFLYNFLYIFFITLFIFSTNISYANTYKIGNIEISKEYNTNFNKEDIIDKDEEVQGYEVLPKVMRERWYSPMDRSLRRELKSAFEHSYWFDATTYKEVVELKIKYKDGVLQIFFPKYKIAPSSARIFALWITLPAFY